MEDVLQLPEIVVDFETEESLKQGAVKVVQRVKPDWPQNELKFKIFTDGISNKLIGVYVGERKNDMVLVRVYGAKTELFIDRASEIRNMLVLAKAGCGCRLYAKFANGLAYEYIPGDILTIETAKSKDVYPRVAAAMAKMHKDVDLGPEVHKEPCMWKKLRMFLDYSDPEAINDPRLADMPKERLLKEVAHLESQLKGCQSQIVFTHNDLLLANIVVHPESGKVSFIDYEYGDYNYHECDVANHFDEMAGVEDMDFIKHYPSREFQLEWIRCYLMTFLDSPPSEERVLEFYANVNKFSLCFHMMWGLWGLVQAKFSQIDFDFVAFALSRLNEYFRVRDERLAS